MENPPLNIKTSPSISHLEAKIENLRLKSQTKSVKSELSLIKSTLNKLYTANKAQVLQFEETNYNYLVLMRSTHGFYKLFGHSALYYTYSLAPKLNLTAKLQDDKDFTNKSNEGFISIRKPEKLAEALLTLNIKPVKTRSQSGDFLLFRFPWQFTKDQLNSFTEQNLVALQRFNHVVMVDNSIPVLFIQIEELLKAVYENVRGMGSPVEKDAFGYQMLEDAARMSHLYLDLSNGEIDKLTCLKKMKLDLKTIKYQTKLLLDLKIWTPKTCARISEIMIKISDIITREIKHL